MQNLQQNVLQDHLLLVKNYVGKYVTIKTVDGTDYTGWIYTIDPVTNSFIIINHANEANKVCRVECIMGHCICDVTFLHKDETPEDNFAMLEKIICDNPETYLTAAELFAKKKKIELWFQKNLIPISTSEDDDTVLIVMKTLRILSPYRACDCFGDNEIILGKIQGILDSMPLEIDDI